MKPDTQKSGKLNTSFSYCPSWLMVVLLETARSCGVELYLGGGTLRDGLLGEHPRDLDLTINNGAEAFVSRCRDILQEGTIVSLGERHADTCRLVVREMIVDVNGFREGAATIEADLGKRDFTINGLAIPVAGLGAGGGRMEIIDPLGGLADLEEKVIRACPNAFSADPLRLLRAFRFAARLGFVIDHETWEDIVENAGLLPESAAERISYECDQIMASSRAGETIAALAEAGLLVGIVPELLAGVGVDQPAFHHLDVYDHNIESLKCLERVMVDPRGYFPDRLGTIRTYLDDPANRLVVKWAALLHDLGKPATRKVVRKDEERITFYGHDEKGAVMSAELGRRLKWSSRRIEEVSNLVAMHMHPFHLCNTIRRDGGVSRKAMQKICRRAREKLPGLFLLAMADCLAGQGPDRPEGMEEELGQLFARLDTLYQEEMKPVMTGPKLLTGHDLIDTLGLTPGPEFREILEAVESAVIEREITSREEALAWVRAYIQRHRQGFV